MPEYIPSSAEWVRNQVELYERTNGTEPSALVGDEWMILWTIGAKSGTVSGSR